MSPHPHQAHGCSSVELGTAQQNEHDESEVLLPPQHLDSSSPVHRGHAAKPFTSFSVQSQQDDSTNGLDESAALDSQQRVFQATGCDSNSSGHSHTKAVLCLCGAHALARWGWRTWEFAVVRNGCSEWITRQAVCLPGWRAGCRAGPCCHCLCPVQALILIRLFPTSLLLVSVYGLLDNIVRLVFGSVIGQFVDRWVGTHTCRKTLCLPLSTSSCCWWKW
jgi:hypothetical protein